MAEIEEAITSTEEAIRWVVEEHRYLKELAEFIKKIAGKDITQQEKCLKIAFRLCRWAEAAEKRAESAEITTEAELKEMALTLPPEQKEPLIKLVSQLDILSKNILKATSYFFRDVKKNISNISIKFTQREESIEQVLFYSEPQTERLQKRKEKLKDEYAEFKEKKEKFISDLRILLEELSCKIENMLHLLDSMENILKQARDFEKKIEENIAEKAVQTYSKYWHEAESEIKRGNILWQDLVRCISKTNVYMPEAILFFPFMENVVRLCKEEKIEIIYALDKSGRLVGFLTQQVLSNLGMSRGIKVYFLNPKNTSQLATYFKENAKNLKDKRILIVDEYSYTGHQISQILNLIKPILEKGAVYAAVFSSVSRSVEEGTGREYAVYKEIPSWWYMKEYSGVREIETKIALERHTQVEPQIREIAASVRNSLITLAKVIAQYLKNKGY